MAEQDEMTSPYLVFRAWRNYYDELLRAYTSIKDEEYELGRAQLQCARENLLESKERLLRRGMAPEDQWMLSVSIVLLNNVVLTYALDKKEHEILCKYMSDSLDVVRACRNFAAKAL